MKKLDKIFRNSKKVKIDDDTKLVIMSDCHRGTGDNYDNFLKNQVIYEAALNYYYENEFTYIELGDGDEMLEVSNYDEIIQTYLDIFKNIKRFFQEDRFIMVYGNHDRAKKSSDILKTHFYKYYDNKTKKEYPLLEGLNVEESLVLDYHGHDIFLLHGHQVDFLNGTLWRLAKFLIRYVWRTLEKIGLKDPTRAAKNYRVTKKVEKKLKKWSIENDKILIAGHTHRPIFPLVGQSLYFNDGSCIHPNGITCLEIEDGNVSLVRWEYKLGDDDLISVRKRVLEGKEPIIDFYTK